MAAKTILRVDGIQLGGAGQPYLVNVGGLLRLFTPAQDATYFPITPQVGSSPIGVLATDPTFADFVSPTSIISALAGAGAGTTGANGEAAGMVITSELITLDTGAAFTDSVANLLPANSIILAVLARITTTITTAANWSLGDSATAARFAAANSTLTANTTSVGLAAMFGVVSTTAAGPTQAAAAKLRITLNAAPGAGAIRISVVSFQFTPPTS